MDLKTFGALLFAGLNVVSPLAFATKGAVPIIPKVEGPIVGGSHGRPFSSYLGNISRIGYVEEEFFFSGNATRFNLVGGKVPLDGKFVLNYNGTAAYRTRILVRRPSNTDDFNGDVIIEWDNVSFGSDLAISDHPGVYEAGYVFAAVTCQKVGIEGTPGISNPLGLHQWDPERYSRLSIPDDGLSYDIYTQAANAVRHNAGGVLGSLKAQHIFAVGESQSGTRLIAYADGPQILNRSFDGILPVIGFGQAADFLNISATLRPLPAPARAFPARIRDDLDVPVFEVNTETEALNVTDENSWQPDTGKYRYWETAGAGHINTAVLNEINAIAQRDGLPLVNFGNTSLTSIDWRTTLDAAYRHMSTWVRNGTAPPSFPIMERGHNANGSYLVRDQNGNAIGGVRLPPITVPVASYSGLGGAVGTGYLKPLPGAELDSLYPTHDDYVAKIKAAASAALARGICLDYQAQEYVSDAEVANVPPS
ncbi:hypothetical protein CLAIMM_04611 [Cladophialophora immunda]|nr:hypothetical protein CLAIMM_04611 [Cladophialophora immunda]